MLTDDQYVDIGETEWIQRDGTPILYRRMSLSHLRNAAALRERQVKHAESWLGRRRMRNDDRDYDNVAAGAAERSVVAAIMTAYADERERRNHLHQAPSPKYFGYEAKPRVNVQNFPA